MVPARSGLDWAMVGADGVLQFRRHRAPGLCSRLASAFPNTLTPRLGDVVSTGIPDRRSRVQGAIDAVPSAEGFSADARRMAGGCRRQWLTVPVEGGRSAELSARVWGAPLEPITVCSSPVLDRVG